METTNSYLTNPDGLYVPDRLNAEALIKLADFLETLPDEQFDIEYWARQEDGCATVACAVGWAAHRGLAGLTLEACEPVLDGWSGWSAVILAFGLEITQARWLFSEGAYVDVLTGELPVSLKAEVIERLRDAVLGKWPEL